MDVFKDISMHTMDIFMDISMDVRMDMFLDISMFFGFVMFWNNDVPPTSVAHAITDGHCHEPEKQYQSSSTEV